MFRNLLIMSLFAIGSASVPILYRSNPHLFEALMQPATTGAETYPKPAPGDTAMVLAGPKQPLGRTALVPADQRGHFVASFRINGRPFEAIVDTGATAVALNMGTARRAGISVNPGDFIHEVDTANGKARAALVKIPDISIGRIVLRDVQAVVLEDRALRTNLIGMTFLQRLAKYKVEGGNLLLVQ